MVRPHAEISLNCEEESTGKLRRYLNSTTLPKTPVTRDHGSISMKYLDQASPQRQAADEELAKGTGTEEWGMTASRDRALGEG